MCEILNPLWISDDKFNHSINICFPSFFLASSYGTMIASQIKRGISAKKMPHFSCRSPCTISSVISRTCCAIRWTSRVTDLRWCDQKMKIMMSTKKSLVKVVTKTQMSRPKQSLMMNQRRTLMTILITQSMILKNLVLFNPMRWTGYCCLAFTSCCPNLFCDLVNK